MDTTNMAPKSDKNGPSNGTESSIDEDDLQEIASVNNNLDELSNMLDEMENNTNNIMAQLRELLQSSREVRAEFKNLDQPSTQSQAEKPNTNQIDKLETPHHIAEGGSQDEEMKEI